VQSACQVAAANDSVPDDSSPNADAEAGLIPTLADSTWIIPRPEATYADVEHYFTRKTRACTERCVKGSYLQRVVVVVICKAECVEGDRLETDVRSRSSGMDATDRDEVLPRTLG
jgi:hypothetical protein